jgi:hypothetical protein
MKARNWTTWERYMPAAKVGKRTSTAALCMKPWDQILSEEGVEERMTCKEPLWRPYEMYLYPESANAAAHRPLDAVEEMPEKVRV